VAGGYHESGAKDDKLIEYNQSNGEGGEFRPKVWRNVILKGIQLGVATSAFKRYDANTNEPYGVDLVELPDSFVPSTEYVRAPRRGRAYLEKQEKWTDYRALARLRSSRSAVARARQHIARTSGRADVDVESAEVDDLLKDYSRRRYATFYRLAWREMIAPDTERSLYAAILPPGVAHTHGVRSASLSDNRGTVLVAGMWAALPLDYFLRATGTKHLDKGRATRMPAPALEHPLASALLLRTLRLNCLTTAYAKLWTELFNPAWIASERWAYDWPGLQTLHDVTPEWQRDTPLRTERARRSALVEIDALVAVWLGMDADALIAAYRGRFPVLQKYEAVTWFDAEGWKLAGNARTIGQRQTKQTWTQFQEYLDRGKKPPVPEGYTAPFYKANREKEMRKAHAVFQARLDAAVARGEWDPVKQEVPQS
jgi:hypothetical protein